LLQDGGHVAVRAGDCMIHCFVSCSARGSLSKLYGRVGLAGHGFNWRHPMNWA
jgi:hypothetical protein